MKVLAPTLPATEGNRMVAELVRVLERTGRFRRDCTGEQSIVHVLAMRTSMRRDAISAVLNGRSGCSVERAERLALAAGVDLAYLYPDRGPVDTDHPWLSMLRG